MFPLLECCRTRTSAKLLHNCIFGGNARWLLLLILEMLKSRSQKGNIYLHHIITISMYQKISNGIIPMTMN